jgi:hypothetical protein
MKDACTNDQVEGAAQLLHRFNRKLVEFEVVQIMFSL